MTFSRTSRGAFDPAMNTAIATRFPSGELAILTSFVAVDLSKNGYETFTRLALKIDFWRGLVMETYSVVS